MAKLEYELGGDFEELLYAIHTGVMGGSATASYEDGSDIDLGAVRCAVRVYERYSISGSNRVSMNVTLVNSDGRNFVSAITSGGSQAMLLKLNTFGESSFLDTLERVLMGWKRRWP